jgi:hypothetical protein
MPKHAYLDTNAFRYFGHAFESTPLADDLRDKILVSPLSAFEVFAQLADERMGEHVLRQVHAIQNWTNAKRSGLLPWPDEWLYQVWHGKARDTDGFTEKVQGAFNMCLAADSVSSFKQAAADHRKLMDDFKIGKAQEFKNMVDAARREKVRAYDMTRDWFQGIARSVNADPASKPIDKIVTALSAHHEFEQAKLQTALIEPEYNPLSRKNQNDIIDAEQLLYLCEPTLCMITADAGFKSKVRKSPQAARIITAPASDLMNAATAESVLKHALGM